MAEYTVKVLVPATGTDLLTLDEAKMWLGITAGDTSQDALIASLIDVFSEEIAERLNRHPTVTIGYEEVQETWRDTQNGRIHLSHYPVKQADLISVSDAGVMLTPDQYELAENSGKLSNISVGGAEPVSWTHPVVVHYKGGYALPDDCPFPLKRAVVLLIREERIRMVQMQTAGIRQISHKESRVAFFDPNALLIHSASAKSPTLQALDSILYHYMRFPV
jgi:hypothetical protein